MAEYWDKKPLFASHDPGLAHHLFDAARFRRALRAAQTRHSAADDEACYIRAMFPAPEEQGGRDWMSVVEIVPGQVDGLLAAGATICVHNISAGDEDVARFAAHLKAALGFTGRVGASCYLSPEGRGLQTHFDAQSVIVVQIEGKKRWWYSREAVYPRPPGNALIHTDGTAAWTEDDLYDYEPPRAVEQADLVQVDMVPGDVLFVPAGTWHKTQAIEPSLGLVVYLAPLTIPALLEKLTWMAFRSQPAWRGGIPAAVSATAGATPERARHYLAERLHELAHAMENGHLQGVFDHLWQRMLATPGEHMSPMAEASHGSGGQLDPDALLRFAPKWPATFATSDSAGRKDVIALFAGASEISLPASMEPLIRALFDYRGTFTITDAVTWAGGACSKEQVTQVIEILHAEGIVQVTHGKREPNET